jgi:hypothetical protein
MQGMAHFMEQGHRVVERQQARIAFAEIGIVGDDGENVSIQLLLVAEAGHPGAALLARTGKIVAKEQPDRGALAPHFPNPHIGMVDGNVAALLERKTE